MKPQEVTDALKLNQLKDKIWYVVPSCATTGEGLLEGLVSSPSPLRSPPLLSNQTNASQAWLSNNVKSPPAQAAKK
jgi:ADP-ribosylation factor 6